MRSGCQRGIALISVLWITTLLAVIAASFTSSARTEGQLARNMGLRLSEGVGVARLEAVGDLGRLLDLSAVERFVGEGWLTQRHGRIAATAADRQRLNGILPSLLAGAAAEAAPAIAT